MPIELKPLPPPDAVAYLESKGLQVTRAWTDLWQEEHARAFTVAGLTQLDVLQDIQDALREALVQGLDVHAFQKALVPKLQAKGWWGEAPEGGKPLSPERLRLIYDVNTRTAYMAGMWGRIQRQKARWPNLQYSTMRDKRVRPQHRVWEGITLPVDDPWWETHFPPNGFRCRCTVTQRGAAEAEGQPTPVDLPPEAQGTTPWVNPRTGETVEVPKGVDPGWDYNPGKAGWERLGQVVGDKLLAASPRLASAMAERMGEVFTRPLQEAFEAWLEPLNAGQPPSGRRVTVGAILPSVLTFLEQQGVSPESAALTLGDREWLHLLRPSKRAREAALDSGFLARLPERLAAPAAVLWDSQDPGLLYVWALEDGMGKVVVRVDQMVTVAREKVRTNAIRTAGAVQPSNLHDPRYQVVAGSL